MGQVNANSLMNKLSFVRDFVGANDIDIFAVGESWLVSEIPSSFVGLDGYSLVRGDTDGENRNVHIYSPRCSIS